MTDGKRYALYYPRGIDQFADNLRPHMSSHPITVYGTDDLNRRLAEAEQLGIQGQVTWEELTGEEGR
ncbi:MAG TPA: hypothetical protein VK453_25520 [Micromonosporaceae bacterium]|nr:hypothetical protein [Micromonosporaceae bacterium]